MRMKTKNNVIIEATMLELMEIYIDRKIFESMPFHEFVRRCRMNGTKVIENENN